MGVSLRAVRLRVIAEDSFTIDSSHLKMTILWIVLILLLHTKNKLSIVWILKTG